MTKFTKENFHKDGEYLNYGFVGLRNGEFVRDVRFVGRFKAGYATTASEFKSFLIKNFTVEEYFAAREKGGEEGTPLKILESKGFVSKWVKEQLRRAGFPETLEGRRAMIAKQVEDWYAANPDKRPAAK
jgi:hypothetical protein